MKNIYSTHLTQECVFAPFKIFSHQQQNTLVLVCTLGILKRKQNCFCKKKPVQNFIIKFSHVRHVLEFMRFNYDFLSR